jgi:hypothetical protein
MGNAGSAAFPYLLEENVVETFVKPPIWNVRHGTKKSGGGEVTVFQLEKKDAGVDQLQLAQRCLKRMKTLRHPNILQFLVRLPLPVSLGGVSNL